MEDEVMSRIIDINEEKMPYYQRNLCPSNSNY
jgi:hypothetical protein